MQESEKTSILNIKEIFKNKKMLLISGSIIGVIFIFAIVFCTIFALSNISNTKIIQGVRINNIDISNLTREEANSKLQEIINNKNNSTIKLVKDDFNNDISTEQLEVNFNLDDAIEQAVLVGRNKNIISNNFEILNSKIKGKNIELNIELNEEILNQNIDEINGQIPDALKDNSYYIEESDLIITKGTEGNKINKDELIDKIKENIHEITNVESEIEIPVYRDVPGPIDIEKIYNEIHTEAKDAYYTKDPFEIHPHVNGVEFAITMEEAKKIIEEDKQEYIIPLKITIPNITTDKLGNEAFPDQLSTFTTKYDGGNVNRSTNLAIAARKINGTVVMPGDTFSYNATVGQRTIAAGYKDAAIYQNGKVVDGLAGGICQISSTLYNSVLLANLDIVSRKNHGFVTSYIGAGRDATVVYGAVDFRFKNTRKYPIKIVASVSNGIAKISIFGVKEEVEYNVDIQSSIIETIPFNITYIDDDTLQEGTEIVEQKGTNGCKSVTYKILTLNGNVISRKLLSNDIYNSMERVIRRGTKKQEQVQPTTPTSTPTTTQQTTTQPEKAQGNGASSGNTGTSNQATPSNSQSNSTQQNTQQSTQQSSQTNP